MKFLSALLLICSIAFNLSAQKYYVSTSGADAKDGSSANPGRQFLKRLEPQNRARFYMRAPVLLPKPIS